MAGNTEEAVARVMAEAANESGTDNKAAIRHE